MLTLSNPKEIRLEVVRHMPVEKYNAAPGLRQSLLKTFVECYSGCPALYKHNVEHPRDYDSKAFREGSAFHTKLLEPDQFKSRYRIMTDSDRESIFQAGKADGAVAKSKAAYMSCGSFSEWEEKNGAKGFTGLKAYKDWLALDAREVISFDFARHMDGMINALRSNRDVMDEISDIKLDDMEASLFAPYDFKDGRVLQLKCRVDLIAAGDTLLDLKTCRTTNGRKFASDAARYGYDFQAATYLMIANLCGLNKRRFGFVAQEKEPPYLNCIHFVPEAWIKYARVELVKPALTDLAEAMRKNEWPNPITGEMEPPGYLSNIIEAHL